MRDQKINLESVYYRPLLSTEDKIDRDGNITGEKVRIFGDVSEVRMNVSPPKSSINHESFGADTEYDRTLVKFGECRIKETSSLWIGFPRGIKAYSDNRVYKVGEYTSKNGGIYECRTAIKNPEAFNHDHWEECMPNYIVKRVAADKRHGGGTSIFVKEVPINAG